MEKNEANRRKNTLKISLALFLSLIFILSLFIFSLPSIISTDWGQTYLTKLINTQISGSVQIKKIQLSWFGKQSIEGLELKSQQNEPLLYLQSLQANASLFNLIWSSNFKGELFFNGLNAKVEKESNGKTSVENAFRLAKKDPSALIPSAPLPIMLKEVNGKYKIGQNQIGLLVQGTTQQGSLSGQFEVDIQLSDLLPEKILAITQNLPRMIDPNQDGKVKLKINAKNLPVDLIEQLAILANPKSAGLIRAALGDKIDISTDQMLSKEGLLLQLTATSPSFSADISATLNSEQLFLNKPAQILLNINPEIALTLAKTFGYEHIIQLEKTTQASLMVDRFELPLNPLNVPSGKFLARVEINDADFKDEPLGHLSLQRINVAIEALESSDKFSINLQADANQNEQPFHINLETYIAKTLDSSIMLKSFSESGSLKIELSSVPSSIADKIFQTDKLFADALGPMFNLSLNARSNAGHALLDLKMESEKISLPNLNLKIGDAITLTQPTVIQYHLGTSLINHFFQNDFFNYFHGDIPLAINLQKISIPFPKKIGQDSSFFLPHQYIIEGDVSTSGIILHEIPKIGTIDVNDLRFALNGTSLGEAEALFIANIQQHDQNGSINTLLGPNTEIKMNSAFTLTPGGNFLVKNFKGKLKSHLAELHLMGHVDNNVQDAKIDIVGHTALSGQNGSIVGKINLKNWLNNNHLSFQDSTINLSAQIEKFPAKFIEEFANQDYLGALLSPSLDISIHANLSKKFTENVIDLDVKGDGLNASASLKIADSVILKDSNHPATLRMSITPDRFKAFRKMMHSISANPSQDQITLLENGEINAKIFSLYYPLKGSELQELAYIPLSKAALKAELSADKLMIADQKRGQKLSFANLKAKFDSQEISKKIAFDINGQQISEDQSQTDLIFKGSLENLFAENGSFNSAMLSLALQSKIKQLPIILISRLIHLDPSIHSKLEALFGETLDADIEAHLNQMKGPIVAKINSKNGNIYLDASIANGFLTLNKNFEAQFALTPKLGKSVLEEIFPLASGLIGAENPLTISIDTNGFACPIEPFELSKLNIGLATLDLGKVKFSKDGQLGQVLSLLNTTYMNEIAVWFTPVYLRMNDGEIKLERADLLIMNLYPIATWGKVDLLKDKVNIIIGLTGEAINKAFNIPDLQKSYILQLPLKGTTTDASIDKRKAVAKLSGLVAQTQGATGLVLGTVFQIASGALSEEKTPPPTTKPLPWEVEPKEIGQNETTREYERPANEQPVSANESEPKQKHGKHKAKHKEIEKAASTILNNFFR